MSMGIFSKLPRDLLIEVVLRLPAKAVHRFRCVSKFFNHLISSDRSRFARSYSEIWSNKRYNNFNNFVVPSLREYFKDNYELEEPDELANLILSELVGALLGNSHGSRFMFRDDRKENYKIHLGGCCNGILCLYQWRYYRHLIIYLFNPALNQVRVLPRLAYGCGPDKTKVCFVCDPLTHDYKVVVIGGYHPPGISIYSLKNDVWRKVKTGESDSEYLMMRGYGNYNLVVHNGCPHWLSHRRAMRIQELVVNVLDMTEETTREIPLPAEFSAPRADSFPDPYHLPSSKTWPGSYDSSIEMKSHDTGDYLEADDEYYDFIYGGLRNRTYEGAESIPERDSTLHLERYKGCLAVTYDDLRFWDPVVELWVLQEDAMKEWVKHVIVMDVPRWVYEDDGYKYGVVCRTPWAATTWTYMISNSDDTVILTDAEDVTSAQKCRIVSDSQTSKMTKGYFH